MQKGNSIIHFKKEHFFLDNFKRCTVEYDGIVYGSSEAAFQAQKAPADKRIEFASMTPSKAKHEGGKNGPYRMEPGSREMKEWQDRAYDVMKNIVRAKFTQHPKLAKQLIDTGDLRLIEGNGHGDNLWGIPFVKEDMVKYRGKWLKDEEGKYILACEETDENNHLGKILMEIRDELKEAAE